MKQIILDYRNGNVNLTEVPVPACGPYSLIVRNAASLVSIGTERSAIELGAQSLLGKARTRPDLLKRFLEKARNEGFLQTFKTALNLLEQPTALGYSSAGMVVEVGKNIHKFSPGDRVACIGAGFASHASFVAVPENLCARIPAGLSFEEASFGMLGIIALNGIRSAKLSFGESAAVIGLGLLGLLSVQILKAYGCRVIGMDVDEQKMELARQLGADSAVTESEFIKACDTFSDGGGVDAVIITTATKSDAPVHQAVEVVRFGGRISIVGVADIHPHRNEMWHKEVEVVVSKAGGAGTFDPVYEKVGIDYPRGYVRWTEGRNLEEFLRLAAQHKVELEKLISHRFGFDEAQSVYSRLLEGKGGPYIGVVLAYPNEGVLTAGPQDRVVTLTAAGQRKRSGEIPLGVIGAGLFGKALLLPALKKIKAFHLHTLATASGASAHYTARKYGFDRCTTDHLTALGGEIEAVVIASPHSLHEKMVLEAIQAEKHVFVEKPLCIHPEELYQIMSALQVKPHLFLMVGYNRRFSPHADRIKRYLENRRDPLVMQYRVNAGFIPASHWVHSSEEGGGRIIGEVCHFIDFMQVLTGCNPIRIFSERIAGNNQSAVTDDNAVITLKFEDGSVGAIIYSAAGDRACPREQIEIFCEGKTIVSTDFKETVLYQKNGRKAFRTRGQEMGYREELQHFADVIQGKTKPRINPDEIFFSTQTVFSIHDSLQNGRPAQVALPVQK